MEENTNIEKRISDICRRCQEKYVPIFTAFFTQEQQVIVKKTSDAYPEVLCVFFGGITGAERKIAGFFPSEIYAYSEQDAVMSPDLEEMAELAYIKISGSGFVEFSHRHILGTLMAIGIKRETIGDIVISDDKSSVYVVVIKSVVQYICAELDRVSKDKVKVSQVKKSDVPIKEQRFLDISLTIASIRLDALVSGALSISRDKAKKLICSGKVQINHAECSICDREFSEGDIITVRGEGKYIVDSFLGKSAKGRYRVVVRKYL